MTCSRCRRSLEVEDFPWKNQAQGVRGGICKECMRIYNKAHYVRNKPSYIARANANRDRIKDFVRGVKSAPCTDCGVSYPYYVMDLDHLGLEEKDFNLGHPGIYGGSLSKVKKEVEKCEVVCANCHRIRTHERLSL